jgi:hypothetical protein
MGGTHPPILSYSEVYIMPILREGTTSLPLDAQGTSFQGGVDDNSLIWALRVDPQLSLRVALWGTNNQPLLTPSNPGVISSTGLNQILVDAQVPFAAAAGVNTTSSIDVSMPASIQPNGYAYLAITNPSTVSTMTVVFQNKEIFSASGSPITHYAEVTRQTVPANRPEGVVYIIQGWLLGDGARVVIFNNTIIEAGGITVAMKARRI